MKKILWATPFILAGVAYAAPITTPWIAPGGGISANSKINAPNTSLDKQTVLSVAQSIDANTSVAASALNIANSAIPVAQKGAAGGVAGLDSSGTLSSTPIAPGMTGSQASSGITANGNAITAETSRATSAEASLIQRSTIGQPNGVAGLDGNSTLSSVIVTPHMTGTQVEANINSNSSAITAETQRAQTSEATLLPKSAVGAANGTAATDSANNIVLPSGASLITNGGHAWQFFNNGWNFYDPAIGTMSLSGINSLANGAVTAGNTSESPFTPGNVHRIDAFNIPSDSQISSDTVLYGGHGTDDVVFQKNKCENYSGGDQGGSCFQIIDGPGAESSWRSGAGGTDGINLDVRSQNSQPFDVIGGGVPSADGVTYTVQFVYGSVIIKPGLSSKEKSIFRNRMALWTNYANGMATTESMDISKGDNVDMPNYYYAYSTGYCGPNDSTITTICVDSYYYQGAGGTGNWRSFLSADSPAQPPGQNPGDTFDNQIPNNTNHHSYSVPALFVGGAYKNFNEYHLQAYAGGGNSWARDFDNEWDFWAFQDHAGEVSMHGLTMTWGNTDKPLAGSSYMMRLAGFNIMPLGVQIDGVINGHRLLSTDAGLQVFEQHGSVNTTVGSTEPGAALGATAGSDGFRTLWNYASADGSANTSVHLGIARSGNDMTSSHDPLCAGDGYSCTQTGQIVYDPSGYLGGVALGVGQGSGWKAGLIVDASGNAYAPNTFSEPWGTPASSSAPCTQGQVQNDANYHYVCVSANTWKRDALSSW